MKAKINKESLKIVISLAAIAFVAALLLAVVNYFTAVDEAEELKKAIAEAYPDSELTELDTSDYTSLTGTSLNGAYRAADGAYIFLVHVAKANRIGYSADGVALITVIDDGAIIKVVGYSHSETPGLGSKAADWFKKGGKGDITGKNPGESPLKVTKDGGDVDAITASTITSRAFLQAVNNAYAVYMKGEVDASSGASGQVEEPVETEADTDASSGATQPSEGGAGTGKGADASSGATLYAEPSEGHDPITSEQKGGSHE